MPTTRDFVTQSLSGVTAPPAAPWRGIYQSRPAYGWLRHSHNLTKGPIKIFEDGDPEMAAMSNREFRALAGAS
jgi:hypothetical protein